jgi:hypothetical protein
MTSHKRGRLAAAFMVLVFGLVLLPCAAPAVGGPWLYPPGSQPTTLSGSVVDTSGAPIGGAWVETFCPCMYDFCNEMMPYNYDFMALTDYDGHYSVGLPESGPVVVSVLAGGSKSPLALHDLAPGSSHLDFALGAGDGTLLVFGWGVEQIDGVWRRSAGATIEFGSGVTTTSAADAFFTVTDEQTDTIAVSKPGFYTDSGWWGNVQGLTERGFSLYPIVSRYPSADTVTVQSRHGVGNYTLSALLTAKPSIPAKGARIYLQRYVTSRKRWTTAVALKTNRSGRARRSLKSKKRTVSRYRWYAPAVGSHGKVVTPTQRVVVK